MNKNEIAEIQDVIGMLGDIEEHDVGGQGGYAEECAFRLFQLIKPHIEADIANKHGVLKMDLENKFIVRDECQ